MKILIFHKEKITPDFLILKLKEEGHQIFPLTDIMNTIGLIQGGISEIRIDIAIIADSGKKIEILWGINLAVWAVIEKEQFFLRADYSKKFVQRMNDSWPKFESTPVFFGDLEDPIIIEKISAEIKRYCLG